MMRNNMKKIIAMILALTLLLALGTVLTLGTTFFVHKQTLHLHIAIDNSIITDFFILYNM